MNRAIMDIETVPSVQFVESDSTDGTKRNGSNAALDALTGKIVCVGLLFCKAPFKLLRKLHAAEEGVGAVVITPHWT